MEKSNDIFFGGGYALVHLAAPILKKYSTTFVWEHSFSRYVFYDGYFNTPPLVRICTHLE